MTELIGIPARKAWNSWQQRRTDAKILNRLANATKEQIKKRKDEHERCKNKIHVERKGDTIDDGHFDYEWDILCVRILYLMALKVIAE